jgi:hypothetical protein
MASIFRIVCHSKYINPYLRGFSTAHSELPADALPPGEVTGKEEQEGSVLL